VQTSCPIGVAELEAGVGQQRGHHQPAQVVQEFVMAVGEVLERFACLVERADLAVQQREGRLQRGQPGVRCRLLRDDRFEFPHSSLVEAQIDQLAEVERQRVGLPRRLAQLEALGCQFLAALEVAADDRSHGLAHEQIGLEQRLAELVERGAHLGETAVGEIQVSRLHRCLELARRRRVLPLR
jgi:hypothetical protein